MYLYFYFLVKLLKKPLITTSQLRRKNIFVTIDLRRERFLDIFTYIHERKTLKEHINDPFNLNVHTQII